MKCANCGHDIKEGTSFCGQCGTPVASGPQGGQANDPSPRRTRNPLAIVAPVAAAVVAVAVALFIAFGPMPATPGPNDSGTSVVTRITPTDEAGKPLDDYSVVAKDHKTGKTVGKTTVRGTQGFAPRDAGWDDRRSYDFEIVNNKDGRSSTAYWPGSEGAQSATSTSPGSSGSAAASDGAGTASKSSSSSDSLSKQSAGASSADSSSAEAASSASAAESSSSAGDGSASKEASASSAAAAVSGTAASSGSASAASAAASSSESFAEPGESQSAGQSAQSPAPDAESGSSSAEEPDAQGANQAEGSDGEDGDAGSYDKAASSGAAPEAADEGEQANEQSAASPDEGKGDDGDAGEEDDGAQNGEADGSQASSGAADGAGNESDTASDTPDAEASKPAAGKEGAAAAQTPASKAYSAVVKDLEARCGKHAMWASVPEGAKAQAASPDMVYVSGLAFVEQRDFNADGVSELLVAYWDGASGKAKQTAEAVEVSSLVVEVYEFDEASGKAVSVSKGGVSYGDNGMPVVIVAKTAAGVQYLVERSGMEETAKLAYKRFDPSAKAFVALNADEVASAGLSVDGQAETAVSGNETTGSALEAFELAKLGGELSEPSGGEDGAPALGFVATVHSCDESLAMTDACIDALSGA